MHYQVVARLCMSSEKWEYYPYWSPIRDKSAATRLAHYAAQSGYEAAILQSVTAEMLRSIAHGVVERQDDHLLPALRYLPGERVATSTGRWKHNVATGLYLSEAADPYLEGPDKVTLDGLRMSLEVGPGGDVISRAGWQPQRISLPLQISVLGAWLSLHRRVFQGQIGGPLDGALTSLSDD